MASPKIAATTQGAILATEHMGRRMKAYAITEGEMDHISIMNGLATGSFSAASFFIALVGGIYTGAAFVARDQLPAEGKVLTAYGAPLLMFLAFIFVCAGCVALWSKHSTWKKIKAESQPSGT